MLQRTPSIRQVAADPTSPARAGLDPGSASITLSRPISTHDGDKSVLNLRAPTLSDYMSHGDIDVPIATDFVNGVATTLRAHTDREALIKWAAALTGLDRVVLGQLSAADAGRLFEAVRTAVLPFSRGNSQTGSTSSSS